MPAAAAAFVGALPVLPRRTRAPSPARMSAAEPPAAEPRVDESNAPAPAVSYGRIQHVGVLVRDTQQAKRFYMSVFGMADDDHLRNPKLPFRGAFLRAGHSQIHLMQLPSPDPLHGRPEHGGRDRHLALTVGDLEPLLASLRRHNRPFTMSRSGRRALFTRDLDANAIEFIEDASI